MPAPLRAAISQRSSIDVPCLTIVWVPEPAVVTCGALAALTSAGAIALEAESCFTSGSRTLCQNDQFHPYVASLPLKQLTLLPPKKVSALAPFTIAS